MVDAGVEAKLVHDVAAFVRPAGDADGAGALEPGDLADDRADRAGRGRNHHRLARLRPTDVEQPGIGGHARHAEHAERGRDRRQRGVDLSHELPTGDGVGLPAIRAEHDVAHGKAVIIRGHNLADGAAFHHLADADRRGVRRRIAHPSAHVGIERQPQRAEQHLAHARRRDRHVLDAEITFVGLADRPRRQHDPLAGSALGKHRVSSVASGYRGLRLEHFTSHPAASRPPSPGGEGRQGTVVPRVIPPRQGKVRAKRGGGENFRQPEPRL